MADLPLSSLSDAEKETVSLLGRKAGRDAKGLELLERYRDAEQRVEHIGLAVPPELRRFEASINVPGMAVREVVHRQELRAFVRTGGDGGPDKDLEEVWEFNNLASQSTLAHRECRTYGRAFVSVSANDDPDGLPLITVEATKGMGVLVDKRRRSLKAALRTYRDDDNTTLGTLYLPERTLWLRKANRGWMVEDRDDHNLGKVPLVMFLNDPSAGDFTGRSQMADVIKKVDGIARTLTNMQVAGEVAAIPSNVIFGVTEADFQDEKGEPIPTWEAYWTKLKAISNEKGHLDQVSPADLKNFTHVVDRFMVWCAVELGLPTRYAGLDTTNPASEGAIAADADRLVRRVENINKVDGDAWAWVMGLAEEFRTGEAPERNSIRALWHDPATPTYSQRADAVMKLRSQGLLSVEGSWDELGWSEERKRREREYLVAERSDPLTQAFLEQVRAADDLAGV